MNVESFVAYQTLPAFFLRRRSDWASEPLLEPSVVDAVALASGRFEAGVIDNRDLTAMVADQPGALQLSRNRRDSGAAHAEHRRQEFMRYRHDVRLDAVARHQQPARATLLHRMDPVAGGGLRAHVQNSCGEAQQHAAHGGALVKCRLAQSG